MLQNICQMTINWLKCKYKYKHKALWVCQPFRSHHHHIYLHHQQFKLQGQCFYFLPSQRFIFFYCVILPVKYMYGTWRTLYAHKGHCEHVKCVFLEMYFESWETTQMFKFSMSQLIFRIPQDVRLDSLNSRCFRLILWPSPRSWSRKWFPCVFFIHTNPHSVASMEAGLQSTKTNKQTNRLRLQSGLFHFGNRPFCPSFLVFFSSSPLFMWFWLCLLHYCPTSKWAVCACLF